MKYVFIVNENILLNLLTQRKAFRHFYRKENIIAVIYHMLRKLKFRQAEKTFSLVRFTCQEY